MADSALSPPPVLPNPAAARRRLEAESGGDLPSIGLAEDEALWGVWESATARLWRLRDSAPDTVQAIASALGVPEMVARLLALRGVSPSEAGRYVSPTLKDLLPDPAGLTDMDRATARLAQAVRTGEKVCVFADYDVDGATSAALMLRLLRGLGLAPDLYVPDRMTEGYGPSGAAMARIAETGTSLVVTLDCGATAHAALEAARAEGLEVVVIDHHMMDAALPPAVAVVNPNRPDDSSGLGMLAAVGVSFMVCVGLVRTLRSSGWFEEAGRAAPDLRGWLDLVALGTVCDVVPLTGLNRAFVVQGLKIMAGTVATETGNPFPGLAALGRVAGLNETPGPYHLGFILGPRINAGGRIGRSDLGACLLSTTDVTEAQGLARELDALNTERREIEAGVLDDAGRQAEAALAEWPARPVLTVQGDGWHAGVIGIVAGRLKDRFGRPSLVLGVEGDTAKGSARSVTGVDLGGAVLAARDAGLLINGGGHAMAAGVTVAREGIAALDRFLCDRLARPVAEAQADPSLWIDATVSLPGATRDLYDAIQATGPFGAASSEPRVAIRDCLVTWVQIVGEVHIRVTLSSPHGAKLTAMAFRSVDTPLGEVLMGAQDSTLHVVGHLRADNYKGRNGVQLHLTDVATA